ncbi:hypothetical protein EOL72_03135 [Candidatus Falkowbacteria bacterium]|nr:hypothetical protein [Candidatus Falkowbacteria bacterium]
MKKRLLLIILGLSLIPLTTQANSLSTKLSGRILLQVEKNGEAWYLNPEDQRRYFLGRPDDAFRVMRELGLGISEENFNSLPREGKIDGNLELAKKLAGRILLQTEKNGEAWYLNPLDLKAYYLGRPDDAFKIMREHGLGINNDNITKILIALNGDLPDKYLGKDVVLVKTDRGSFLTTILKIDLRQPNLKVLTLAAEPRPCPEGVCAAKPLKEYLEAGQGFAAINGSYFCSGNDCGGLNYYFSPLYESRWEVMINRDKMNFPTTGPIAIIDNENHWHYFKDVRDFVSPENFQAITGRTVSAALSNQPRILENGENVLETNKLTTAQKNRGTRQALAYKDNPRYRGQGALYLISIGNATLEDLGAVLEKFHFDNALNLDGGGSAALIYENEFLVGPGRDIPNAIVFKK